MTTVVADANGNDVAIIEVADEQWGEHDDVAELEGSTVIGRCRVRLAGGGELHALVVTGVRDYAVWWDRYRMRFCATPLPLDVRGAW